MHGQNHIKFTVYSFQVLMKFEIFSTYFQKMHKYKMLWKSVHWEPTELLHAEGRTDGRRDTTRLIVAFRNFANARNNNYWKTTGTLDKSRFPDRDQDPIIFKSSFPSKQDHYGIRQCHSQALVFRKPWTEITNITRRLKHHTPYHRCKGKAEVIPMCATKAHGEVMI